MSTTTKRKMRQFRGDKENRRKISLTIFNFCGLEIGIQARRVVYVKIQMEYYFLTISRNIPDAIHMFVITLADKKRKLSVNQSRILCPICEQNLLFIKVPRARMYTEDIRKVLFVCNLSFNSPISLESKLTEDRFSFLCL